MTKPNVTAGPAESAVRLCWHCRQPVSGEPFCPSCSKLQSLPEGADHFQIFGLEFKKMNLELKSLEEAFYSLSRQVHPDRYQSRNPRERQIAEERTAALNVAYRTLRDPIARTEYLLALEEGSPREPHGQPAVELLLEIMEFQEAIEAYRSSQVADRKVLEDSLNKALLDLEARCETIMGELREAFCRWDRRVLEDGSGEAKGPLLERFREILNQRRYFMTTIRDISAALASEPAPGRHGD